MYHAVRLQIASLVWSKVSAMAAGDPSQTTPVQIMHVLFALCCSTQIEWESKLYILNLHKTTQQESMHNLYWCSLANGMYYTPG